MNTGGQKMRNLTISELAKETNVNVATVRYYEKRGLIAAPPRTESGYRMFSHETAADIKLIKRAQDLGFTLEEIKTIILIYKADHYFPTEDMYQFANAKIKEIDEKINQLNNLKSLLENAMNVSDSALPPPKQLCPLLNILSKGEDTNS